MLEIRKNKIKTSNIELKNMIHDYTKIDYEKIKVLLKWIGIKSMIFNIVKYDILSIVIELFISDNCKDSKKSKDYIKDIFNYNALSFEEIVSEKHMSLLRTLNSINGSISEISEYIIELIVKKFFYKNHECINDESFSPKINYIINMALKVDDKILVDYMMENFEFKYKLIININEKDIFGYIAIIEALNNNNKKYFKYLLDYDVDVNIKDNKGNSLISLIMNNYPHFLKTLFKKENISINEKNANGNRPLTDAIIENNIETVMELVSYGEKYEIDMNVKVAHGNTLLILSYKKGHMKIFNHLINHLDINEKDDQGFSTFIML